jgi:hypothetical protein
MTETACAARMDERGLMANDSEDGEGELGLLDGHYSW